MCATASILPYSMYQLIRNVIFFPLQLTCREEPEVWTMDGAVEEIHRLRAHVAQLVRPHCMSELHMGFIEG